MGTGTPPAPTTASRASGVSAAPILPTTRWTPEHPAIAASARLGRARIAEAIRALAHSWSPSSSQIKMRCTMTVSAPTPWRSQYRAGTCTATTQGAARRRRKQRTQRWLAAISRSRSMPGGEFLHRITSPAGGRPSHTREALMPGRYRPSRRMANFVSSDPMPRRDTRLHRPRLREFRHRPRQRWF